MQIKIMSFEDSWNMELQKINFYKNKNIKWQNYFISEDFLKENINILKLKYKKMYKNTPFEIFKFFIPKWIEYDIILNCGVGGIYNEAEKKIYISVNSKTKIDIFYDTLIHEYCHIKYNHFFCGLPHDFLEEGIEVIAAKKYGVYSFDHKKYNLFDVIELDHLRSSIIKAASKYDLLTKEKEKNNVFTFIP
jgi:hypothetical protein